MRLDRYTERNRAGRNCPSPSFASRGSGVQIPSAPPAQTLIPQRDFGRQMGDATAELIAFVRARLNDISSEVGDAYREDAETYGDTERVSVEGGAAPYHAPGEGGIIAEGEWFDRFVAAGRAVVDNTERAREAMGSAPIEKQLAARDGPAAAYWRGQDFVLRHFAAIWADHPDYDPNWTPV